MYEHSIELFSSRLLYMYTGIFGWRLGVTCSENTAAKSTLRIFKSRHENKAFRLVNLALKHDVGSRSGNVYFITVHVHGYHHGF